MKFLVGTVIGVASGVLKHNFGTTIAISVATAGVLGAMVASTEPGAFVQKVKKFAGITLIGALVGYGLNSIPAHVWHHTFFHVRLN